MCLLAAVGGAALGGAVAYGMFEENPTIEGALWAAAEGAAYGVIGAGIGKVAGPFVRQGVDWVVQKTAPLAKKTLNSIGQGVAKLTGKGGGKAGPGAWGEVTESMSQRAASYQQQITGVSSDSAYLVGGVKFDGYANGVLLDAKGPGYASFVKDGEFCSWFRGASAMVDQATRQVAVAGGTPITWSIAEKPVVSAISKLLENRGIVGIKLVHVPAG